MPRDADAMVLQRWDAHSLHTYRKGTEEGGALPGLCAAPALLVPLIERYQADMDSFSFVELAAVPCLELPSSLHRFSKLPWRMGALIPSQHVRRHGDGGINWAVLVVAGTSIKHHQTPTLSSLVCLGLATSSIGEGSFDAWGNCRSQSREADLNC